MAIKMFVYGTLMRRQGNNYLSENCGVYEKDATIDNYILAEEHPYYPYMIERDGAKARGEVWIISDFDAFSRIVAMEEGAGYTTEILLTNEGDIVLAFVYAQPLRILRTFNNEKWNGRYDNYYETYGISVQNGGDDYIVFTPSEQHSVSSWENALAKLGELNK